MTTIGDANDRATILADAKAFLSDHFAASDADEIAGIDAAFGVHRFPPYWIYGQLTSGLIQVYDLVAPIDADLADTCLSRLGAIAGALLANRDDRRGFPEDPFRGRVMPAWGAVTPDRDRKWNTDPVTAGLFVYAMAAFARRVADRPVHSVAHRDAAVAVGMITAAIETYEAFRPELHLVDSDPHAFYNSPLGYRRLACADGNHSCTDYRAGAGKPIAYNESLSMMKALAELGPAADSSLYRGSADATPARLKVATEEVPLAVAKNVAYRVADLRPLTLSDGSPYYDWHYEGADRSDDVAHAQFELGCLAVILDAQVRLNGLLERAGRAERVPLSPGMFVRFANTFLRKVWRNDVLSGAVDGSGEEGHNEECAGWIPLSQFDPWVWTRARDTTFHTNPSSPRVDIHGALLYYRRFNSMKFLTDFAGQNWLITPAALAVGERHPESIHEQKFLLVLSGVVFANQRGDNSGQWNHQTVSFIPDMAGPDDPTATSGPLNFAIGKYHIPRPQGAVGAQYLVRFCVEEWSPFVSLNSVFDQAQSLNAGFAVDAWRPNHFETGVDVITQQPVGNIFTGVNADLAVNDSDAWIYRLGYNITLLGRIVFIAPSVIL